MPQAVRRRSAALVGLRPVALLLGPCLLLVWLTLAPTLAGAQGKGKSLLARGHHRPHGPRRPCPGSWTPVRRSRPSAIRRTALCLVNYERRLHGLGALRRLHEIRRLDRAAQWWTNTMVGTGNFRHSGFIGARVAATGYPWALVGENIASGFTTPALVVRAWMRSPEHCRNMLDPRFTDLGVGVQPRPVGGGGYGRATWTLDFGLPMHERPPSLNWGPASACPYRG